MKFNEFYSKFNLRSFPFYTFTTEEEQEVADLFVEPTDYILIKEAFKGERTIVMSGSRGIGKTAIVYDLRRSLESTTLLSYIDDYSQVSIPATLLSYYQLIITGLVNSLALAMPLKAKQVRHLPKKDRIFLSLILSKYSKAVTKRLLEEHIEEIQIGRFWRTFNKCSNFIRLMLNYGLTIAVSALNSTVLSFFSIPPLDTKQIINIIPELKVAVDSSFSDIDESYSLIQKICMIIRKIGYKKIVVMFDKIDEDSRNANDSKKVAEFIKPVLTDNKLLLCNDLQFVFSIWALAFSEIKDQVRTQKFYCPTIKWDTQDLVHAFNRRVEVYSSKPPLSFDDFFADDVTDADKSMIITLSNHNPRDLWHLFESIFRAQFGHNSQACKIEHQALLNAFRDFVQQFNYFEYYPKKLNSRKTTMDIYKYIAACQRTRHSSNKCRVLCI